MSTLAMGILTGLGAAVGFGLGDFFAARASRQYSAWHMLLWGQVIKLGLVATTFLVLGWHFQFTGYAMVLALCSGVILVAGQLAAFQAFKLGPVGLASPFVSGYALVAAALSLLFLHEYLRPLQLAAVALLIFGGVLASISGETNRPRKDFWRQPTVLLALTAAFCIGVCLFFLAQLVHEIGWQSAMLLQCLVVTVCAALLLQVRKVPLAPDGRWPVNRTVLVAAAFGFVGTVMINFGFSSSLVAIVAPVASISPLITVGLALLFFKERLSVYQLTGALVVIFALSLLSVR
ncbi:MAG TPA: DMT family transporter [Candidatus Polarisedimenticolaceae bacterium]|nr:DMT family transporter [Candidatus Polarisedimenticolaceae bacterium]